MEVSAAELATPGAASGDAFFPQIELFGGSLEKAQISSNRKKRTQQRRRVWTLKARLNDLVVLLFSEVADLCGYRIVLFVYWSVELFQTDAICSCIGELADFWGSCMDLRRGSVTCAAVCASPAAAPPLTRSLASPPAARGTAPPAAKFCG